MTRTEKKVKRLLRKNSQSRLFGFIFLLILVFLLSIGLRVYIIEPIQIQDVSMQPLVQAHQRVWVCKLERCLQNLKAFDTVLAKKRQRKALLRQIIGLPGQDLKIASDGHVEGEGVDFIWNDEVAFIDTRKFYIPKKGDSLILEDLNDIEMDFALGVLKNQGEDYFVDAEIYQGEQKLSIDIVGSTRIASRPVSIKEVPYLPWRDLFLIELQIARQVPGASPIRIQRKAYRSYSSEITGVLVQEDYYFLACTQGKRCVDSRELGLFKKSELIGKKL